MDLFTFLGNDLYFPRKGETQSRYNALWEAAAHMNKLQHNLLQRMSESETLGDDFGYLEEICDMFGSLWLVELLECGHVDLGNHSGMDRAYANTLGGELIHQISVRSTGFW